MSIPQHHPTANCVQKLAEALAAHVLAFTQTGVSSGEKVDAALALDLAYQAFAQSQSVDPPQGSRLLEEIGRMRSAVEAIQSDARLGYAVLDVSHRLEAQAQASDAEVDAALTLQGSVKKMLRRIDEIAGEVLAVGATHAVQ